MRDDDVGGGRGGCPGAMGAMRIRFGFDGPRGNGLILLLLIGLSSMGGGCSWLFTQPLPEQYSTYDVPPCSTNVLPPVLDTLFALTNTASAIYVAGQDNVTNKSNAVALGLSVATLWTLSAIYGYRHTSECSDAHAGRITRYRPAQRARPAGPPVYYPPAYTPPSPSPPVPDAGAPVAPAQPPAPMPPPAPQQQDDDDPSRPRRPRPARPIEQPQNRNSFGF